MTLDPRFLWTATRLNSGWAIRPKGALGTCGWINGVPWQVVYASHKPAHISEDI